MVCIFIKTPIPDLFVIEPTVFGDERGFFMESYNKKEFQQIGIDIEFVQDNHSRSKKGTVRGLHFQAKHPQGKLVRVISGEVFDVAVDLRTGSETFGRWFGEILSAQNKKMMYVPEGFAHGFLVLSENADFFYKCTDYYHPEYEAGILWNDSTIAINWPLREHGIDRPMLSDRDRRLPTFRDWREEHDH